MASHLPSPGDSGPPSPLPLELPLPQRRRREENLTGQDGTKQRLNAREETSNTGHGLQGSTYGSHLPCRTPPTTGQSITPQSLKLRPSPSVAAITENLKYHLSRVKHHTSRITTRICTSGGVARLQGLPRNTDSCRGQDSPIRREQIRKHHPIRVETNKGAFLLYFSAASSIKQTVVNSFLRTFKG